MAGASILRQLDEVDLDVVHHMIRRDASSDLEIARWVEAKLRRNLGRTDHARAMVVHRYRAGKPYREWLARENAQRLELEKAVRLQQQRYDVVLGLFQAAPKGPGAGLETVSRALMARLLTLAAEMSDEELKTAASNGGFLTRVIQAQQQAQRIELAAAGREACEVVGDKALSREQQQERIREIFGVTK